MRTLRKDIARLETILRQKKAQRPGRRLKPAASTQFHPMSTATPDSRNTRKTLIGFVTSRSGDKSIKVTIPYKTPHPLYHKVINRKTVVHVHDEKNETKVGDKVEIMETRPHQPPQALARRLGRRERGARRPRWPSPRRTSPRRSRRRPPKRIRPRRGDRLTDRSVSNHPRTQAPP